MNTRTRVRCVVASVPQSTVSGRPLSSLSTSATSTSEGRGGGKSGRRGVSLLRLSFTLSFLKKGSVRTDRSTSYSPPHRDAYLVTGPADCIVITVLNILHRARELTKSAMGVGGRRWNKVEVKGDS